MLNARGIEAPTQRVGHAASMSERVEAVLYPSTVWPIGACLAIFPERLVPGSSLEVIDPDGILLERIP
jgi:RES domain-containing protein